MLFLLACTHPDLDKPAPADGADSSRDTSPDSGTDTGTSLPDLRALQFTGARPVRLLVISVDTVQRAAFGRYSGGDDTPFLDARAAEGVVLDDHSAGAPWTLPGVMGALSGRRPDEMDVIPRISGEDIASGGVPDGEFILPGWLKLAGYDTTLLTTNPYLGDRYMGDQYGFSLISNVPAEALVDEALAMIDGATAAESWMFHLHFIDPHAAYNPPAAYLADLEGRPALDWDLSTEEGNRALAVVWSGLDSDTRQEAGRQLEIRYQGELRYVDDQVARFWDALDAGGQLDDTLVLFWTDHGEQFFEHGSLGHAGSLFNEEVAAVAFWWARNLEPRAWTGPTSHPDLVPTTLDALGIPIPDEITGALLGVDATPARFATLWPATSVPRVSVQIGANQLVYEFSGDKRLYDLDVDPEQRNDLYADAPDQLESLWEALTPVVDHIATLTGETPVAPGL